MTARDDTGSESDASFRLNPPQISLPKGGGAIRGMGEKFAANPVTGTGSMSVPIATSPGRSGFNPQLSLSYDSGAGNGAFGLGWNLSLPSITRRTDKGLPKYLDLEESDVFVLSGAEDLVPVFKAVDDDWVFDAEGNPTILKETRAIEDRSYQVRRYQPRIEGLFALIERWSNEHDPNDTFWRTISRDNVTTWYGQSAASRIFDPADASRVFSWLICESYDDKGNAIVYEYVGEDAANVAAAYSSERNRARTANRYLKRILYGNTPSRLSAEFQTGATWHFEVQFDYGQDAYREDAPDSEGNVQAFVLKRPASALNWPVRDDRFSSYRSGFEVRTYRLCRRVLMFHRFDELLGDEAQLVRATEIEYAADAVATRVRSVTHCSFFPVVGTTAATEERKYLKRTLPPLQFDYSEAVIDGTIRDVAAGSLENLPSGFDGASYQWIDLHGEGLSGILSEQGEGWFYKRNLGPINLESDTAGRTHARAKFAPVERIAVRPNAKIATGTAQFMDLDGDGQLDLVTFDGAIAGFYGRHEYGDNDSAWESFRAFVAHLNRDSRDPNLRFVDLDGDGLADVLITEDEALSWHPSLGEAGFGATQRIFKARDEEAGPALVLADGTQSIYLADMSGDGLADLVRIRNGEICYWPNLGYGAFGAKVTMDDSPWFDASDLFEQRRIHLADIDGSGVTDIVYLHGDGARLYFNQSGNRWSAAQPVPEFPRIDPVSSFTVVDLLGNGTACLVWSSALPGNARQPMKYIDLMSGQKPHLLVGVHNNLGATTTIEYVPSTRFYLQDKLAGQPWITRLPFPVHCVAKVSVSEKWRNTTFASKYSYHHGYFDGIEREFRGFGRVEQIDTEDFGKFAAGNAASPYITADLTLYQPPIKTITWFHTGAALDRNKVLTQFQHEYFPNSLAARPSKVNIDLGFWEKPLPEPDLGSLELNAHEWREALRACKGMMLRQEVYELDIDALQPTAAASSREIPVRLFSAATYNCTIQCLQPAGTNRHAVFLATESEALSYHYELDLRPPAGSTQATALKPDPRVAHTLNLSFDKFGNAQQSVMVGYSRWRQFDDSDLAEHADLIREVQRERHLAYTETHYTEDVIDTAAGTAPIQFHRLRVPCEVQTYELTGILPTAGPYFDLNELRRWQFSPRYLATAPIKIIATSKYHQIPQTTAANMRLVEHARTLFFKDDLSGALDPGKLGQRGLTYERYKLALTGELLDAIFTAGQLAKTTQAGASVRDALSHWKLSGYLSGTDATDKFGPQAGDEYWMRSGVADFATNAVDHFFLPEKYTDPFGNPASLEYGAYDLFIRSHRDALGNTVVVDEFDFRVLATVRMIDPSGNYTAVAFDILGLPIASAAMGKQQTESGDDVAGLQLDLSLGEVESFFTAGYDDTAPKRWLGDATTRYVYDFGAQVAADGTCTYGHRPAGACAIARETHVKAGEARVHVAVEYSDGMGEVLVKKAQAEPDPDSTLADPPLRWIATGKVVANNKGKPVKQYEPYFSATGHRFDATEAQLEVGVTPVMYYDAVGRLIRTESADGSCSRVEFSPWHAAGFDANDTIGEPGNAWYSRHVAASATAEDKRAAALALVHYKTPSLTMLDSLGREVIAIAHNRVADANGIYQAGGKKYRDERYLTFTRLDTESKPLWIRDAKGNLVMQYLWPLKPDRDVPRVARDFSPSGNPNNDIGARVPTYDIAGNLLFKHSMDAGNRWMIDDAAGKLLFAWDFNQRQQADDSFVDEQRMYSMDYDALHRPTAIWLRVNADAAKMIERFEYQDAQTGDANNLNGQRVLHYDASGRTETVRYDFQGNVLETRRRLNNQPTASLIDWSANPDAALESESFTQITQFDALQRLTLQFNWHRAAAGSPVARYLPTYNQRGLLSSQQLTTRLEKTAMDIRIGPDTDTKTVIKAIRYDAKGQKTYRILGNGTITRYDYDSKTYRLRQLRTTRLTAGQVDPSFADFASHLGDARVVQQLFYTYDPIGNVTEIYDAAYQPVFFQNQQVEPHSRYEYDALYRLIQATGRENGAFRGAPANLDVPVASALPVQSTDPNALRNYAQTYQYDPVGNIERLHHEAGAGTWTRRSRVADDSNRLLATWDTDDDWSAVDTTIATAYDYDTHGNMRNLLRTDPRFNMRWDHRDMISNIDLGGGGQAYYQYDDAKQRTRKRIVKQNNSRGYWERVYLGGYELYRRYDGSGTTVVEEIESHHLFEGQERVLLVEDVITAGDAMHARPDGAVVAAQTLLRYQYGNHLGCACLELDHAAEIISYEEYHPYGTSSYCIAKSGVEAPPKRYRFTGKARDEESGLYYYGARYYAAWLCRWSSTDPQELVDGTNVFRYVTCNPIRFVDEHGEKPQDTTIDTADAFKTYLATQGKDHPILKLLSYGGNAPAKKKDQEHLKLYFQEVTRPTTAPGRTEPYREPRVVNTEKGKANNPDHLYVVSYTEYRVSVRVFGGLKPAEMAGVLTHETIHLEHQLAVKEANEKIAAENKEKNAFLHNLQGTGLKDEGINQPAQAARVSAEMKKRFGADVSQAGDTEALAYSQTFKQTYAADKDLALKLLLGIQAPDDNLTFYSASAEAQSLAIDNILSVASTKKQLQELKTKFKEVFKAKQDPKFFDQVVKAIDAKIGVLDNAQKPQVQPLRQPGRSKSP